LRKEWNACVPGLTEADVDVALIPDDNSVYYFTGFTTICTWSLAARRF
jgi:Xaa-Pro aminopeptidase